MWAIARDQIMLHATPDCWKPVALGMTGLFIYWRNVRASWRQVRANCQTSTPTEG